MPLFKFAWGIYQSILALAVIALSVEFYKASLLPIPLPEAVKTATMVAVLIVPVFWILVNALGGGLFGAAGSGGFWDGAKLGFLLGLGTGVSRLWPHTFAWAVGCFAASGSWVHIILLVITSGVLLAMNHGIRYFWSGVHNANLH